MCRNTTYNRIRCHIFRYHSSGTYNGIITDSHSLKNRRVRTYPYILTEYNRCRISRFTVFRSESVIERGEYDVVPDLAAVAEGYPAVILKVAAGVDKHIFTYGDVLTEIRIEGWENAQRLRNFISEQFG